MRFDGFGMDETNEIAGSSSRQVQCLFHQQRQAVIPGQHFSQSSWLYRTSLDNTEIAHGRCPRKQPSVQRIPDLACG